MKAKRLFMVIIFVLSVMTLFMLVGCDDTDPFEGQVKVVFNLEGAKYKNTAEPIVYYYPFEQGTRHRIVDPMTFEEKTNMVRQNYNFKGWYAVREEDEDGNVTYSDEWDFATDTVGDEGIELYAYWCQYTYDIGYLEDGEFVSFNTPTYVMDNQKSSWTFSASKVAGSYSVIYKGGEPYTFLGTLTDLEGNPWDETFEHPRGDKSEAVQVVAEYVKGDWKIVRTAAELKAVNNINSNVYLMDDIDFEGAEWMGIQSYAGIFEGNGHTVKNFKMAYSDRRDDLISDSDLGGVNVLAISVFGRGNGATVRNVKFENVTVDVKTTNNSIYSIYVAPLFVKRTDCKVESVKFTGTFSCSALPTRNGEVFARTDFVVASDRLYCIAEGQNNTDWEVTVNVTDTTDDYYASVSGAEAAA